MTDLTQAALKERLHYDAETGVFTRKVSPGRNYHLAPGSVVGTKTSDGYLEATVCGRRYKLHRLAWLYVHGRFPERMIDHKNGIRADNRLANLRECNHSQNGFNMRVNTKSASGFKGVYFQRRSGRWNARLYVNYKMINLGTFSDIEEAKAAYRRGAKQHYGEFARTE